MDHFYEDEFITPEDVIVVIEVAVSSLKYDRTVKLPIYAKAGIKEYWIINSNERKIEVYKNPAGKKYNSKFVATESDKISIEELGIEIAVKDCFGKKKS